MKKNLFYLTILLFLFMPFSVDALVCNNKVLNVSVGNFRCSGIEGDLSFSFNGEDFGKYLKLRSDGNTIDIDPNIIIPSDVEIAEIEIKDSKNSVVVKIKNNNYIPPTTTTTTTTKPENIIVVTFDKQDGSSLSEKKCSIISGSNSCSIVLPKINAENFNGWGTQSTCKEGITGTIKVNENAKYYACYLEEEVKELKIIGLKILDSKTKEEINYGELEDNKDTYNIRVLNEVDSLEIDAKVLDDVNVTVQGNINLEVGENKVYIYLSDNSNNKKTYTLNVERLNVGETLEKIHYLSSLVIGLGELNFDKDTFVYTVNIDNDIDKLEITPVAFYENDVVTIKNNENLVNGSQILIEISGDDNIVTTYTIRIIKENKINLLPIICGIVVVILGIVLVIILIIKNNNNKKNNDMKKTQEKIRKVKKSTKNNQPDVLNNSIDDEIEVLKF